MGLVKYDNEQKNAFGKILKNSQRNKGLQKQT